MHSVLKCWNCLKFRQLQIYWNKTENILSLRRDASWEQMRLFCTILQHSAIHSIWKSPKKVALRAKRATFTIWVSKSLSKMPKTVHFGYLENAIIQKFKCDIFDDFQTLCGFLNSSSAAWKFELCSKAEREKRQTIFNFRTLCKLPCHPSIWPWINPILE